MQGTGWLNFVLFFVVLHKASCIKKKVSTVRYVRGGVLWGISQKCSMVDNRIVSNAKRG